MKYELFDIVLLSPMGPKKGTLKIFKDDKALSGIITILGFENSFSGGSVDNNIYDFIVKIKSSVGDVSCWVTAEVRDNTLIAVANTNKGVMKLTGVKKEAD